MIVVPGPDLDPVEAARRLAGAPGRFLLHSASNADGVGRWSFVGAWPSRILTGEHDDPFAAVAELASDGDSDEDGKPLPRAVGWLGYELNRAVERLPAPRPRATADLHFAVYDALWRHDGVRGEIVARHRHAADRLERALARQAPVLPPPVLGPLVQETPAERHLDAITRALAYIRAGDVYQVNLSRRLRAELRAPGDPLALYARLAAAAPSPYGAVVESGGAPVLANSPELFLRRLPGETAVETRPIKGTRARGETPAGDHALAAALASDEKERAEHLMIVDLLRNDLGRVAEIGSVRVEGFARLLTLPTVHHLVSTVTCRPRGGLAELLRATFPGGSITGAPKVRAMEIIDELEPAARGVYTGALGWVGAGATLDLCIVIRTAVLLRDHLSLAVGGGVVADSTPVRELEETEEKALAWRRLLEASP